MTNAIFLLLIWEDQGSYLFFWFSFADTLVCKLGLLTYICVGTLQNIYFNTKDSDHFLEMQYFLTQYEKLRTLFILLVWFVDILVSVSCSLGSALGTRSCCIFNFKICIFLLFWAHYTYHTLQNIYFNKKILAILKNMFLWFSLQTH